MSTLSFVYNILSVIQGPCINNQGSLFVNGFLSFFFVFLVFILLIDLLIIDLFTRELFYVQTVDLFHSSSCIWFHTLKL